MKNILETEKLFVWHHSLQMIINQKQVQKQMFNSEEFIKSKFYKQKNGPTLKARKIVLDNVFWSRAIDILKVFERIVKVLRLVDGDTKPNIRFTLKSYILIFHYARNHI
ncbi:hypothetical protein Lal_00027145 [Lupinus albus]|nr:hypothetical protein Lal_00027145 [Lupinus albus]